MAVKVPQGEDISGGEKIEGEQQLLLLSVGKERIGGAYTLRNESKEELFREMLIPT